MEGIQRPLGVQHRRALALALVVLGFCYCVLSQLSPWSWVVMSSCVHAGVYLLKPPNAFDLWTQRTMTWSLLSTLSFAHFLMQDTSFTGWASVYHFCSGPSPVAQGDKLDSVPLDQPLLSAFTYCTTTYRWNLNGWRKALSIWNFVLSFALGLQHLVIELGLGGLLPGEDAIPRECFVSIIWRLVPFFLNKWEADFGAECTSILFELPHFATELLVILPSVQLMAARLRVLSRPPMNARDPNIAPDVMRARWISDCEHRHFWSRLRKNLRPLALVCCVTFVAWLNAVLMPTYLENRAISSLQSMEYMKYREALAALQTGQMRGAWLNNEKVNIKNLRQETDVTIRMEYLSNELIGIMSNTTLYACATSPDGRGCVSSAQHEMVSWMAEQDIIVSLGGMPPNDVQGSEEMAALALNSSMLTAHPLWALNALEFMEGAGWGSEKEKFGQQDGFNHVRTPPNPELLQHVLFGKFFYGTGIDEPLSFVAMQREFIDRAVHDPRHNIEKFVETEGEREKSSIFSPKWKASLNPLVVIFKRQPPTDASRFLLLAEKHTFELERMASEEHRALVPLVEMALTIMRLSCEKWFSLVATFVSFVLFRDPPPHAREYIKVVAISSRVFQHCILMSFPAVCWAYGAGFLFSTFASAVFWTTPIVRLVEHIKKVAMEVQPMHWHPVTNDEVERMGGNCAICWGSIVNVGNVDAAGDDEERELDGVPVGTADAAMGLSCGHAYHQSCLLEWLQSCFGHSRKATCPMCQSQIPLKIRYKLRAMLPFGSHEDGDTDALRQAQHVGIPVAERAYPGLATLALALPDEFAGRWGFDLLVQAGGDDDGEGERMIARDANNDEERVEELEGIRSDEDEPEYSADMEPEAGEPQAHSAHALILSENSASSGSSIHLPERAHQSRCSGTGSVTPSTSSAMEARDEDSEVHSPYVRRLRPRKNR